MIRADDDRPGVGARRLIERALHALAIVLVAVLLWRALRLLNAGTSGMASGDDVRSALVRWSTSESPFKAHVVLDSAPPPDVRDWIAVLKQSGTRMTWEGGSLLPSAISAEPVVDPKRSTRIWVAAPSERKVVVGDALGVIDSTVARGSGAMITVPHAEGTVRAVVGNTPATAAELDSIIVRPVLVLGTASWETKFIVASLEEHGWTVHTRFAIAPTGDIAQGSGAAPRKPPPAKPDSAEPKPGTRVTPAMRAARIMAAQRAARIAQATLPTTALTIDTARYAAVIVLDSVGSRYASQIASYVRSGGGFIATGEAARLSIFVNVLPAIADQPAQPLTFEHDSVAPRNVLALTPLIELKPGALALERQGNRVSVAGWRVGRGRVFQVGYSNTWRWRMGGAESDPVTGYRAWWSGMVSGVAFAPRVGRQSSTIVEPTPLASLVRALGTPEPPGAEQRSLVDDPRLTPLLFGIVLFALFGQWASRRLAGRA